jgi:hypothetical protein
MFLRPILAHFDPRCAAHSVPTKDHALCAISHQVLTLRYWPLLRPSPRSLPSRVIAAVCGGPAHQATDAQATVVDQARARLRADQPRIDRYRARFVRSLAAMDQDQDQAGQAGQGIRAIILGNLVDTLAYWALTPRPGHLSPEETQTLVLESAQLLSTCFVSS